jgi:hypothetical protein
MKSAKIRLSEEEQELVADGQWILTKNRVLQQISEFLGSLQQEQEAWLHQHHSLVPEDITAIPPKIAKGEQYLGLPYRMLDYPRFFETTDIFAIRTFFWWGNFFSVTLQLAGKWKNERESAVLSSFDLLQKSGLFVCTSADPWQHHFEAENYTSLRAITRKEWEKIIQEQAFIKLSTRHELRGWNDMAERLLADFQLLIRASGNTD